MEEENQDSETSNTKKSCLILGVILILLFTCKIAFIVLKEKKMEKNAILNACDCMIIQDFDTVTKPDGGKLHCTGINTCSCGKYYEFCKDFFIFPYTGTAQYLSSGKVIRTIQYKDGSIKKTHR